MKYVSRIFLFGLLLSIPFPVEAEKQIYESASAFGNSDLNSESSQWCHARSKRSENFVIFWESGYGSNPAAAPSPYKVDIDNVLWVAEKAFAMYADSLKFIERGNSKTDTYRMIIRLKYSTTWEANGSGIDDMIGMLTLSASAAQAAGVTVAHEVGHCFQYQVHCDGFPGGWMYGQGENGAGGNSYWEQCAQWQAFKVFPEQQFTDYNYSNYLKWCNKNILHEEARYANYFLQDYWTFLHGWDFIARLWQQSIFPEDPVDTYKRLNNLTQVQFNDEMYDFAARAASWDIPHIRSRGETAMDTRIQCAMNELEDGYWAVDASRCPENYGYNVIKLNPPLAETEVKVCFEGMAGASGYRSLNKNHAGWRFGFVALQNDGTRVYGDMHSLEVSLGKYSPQDTAIFLCPDNCQKLWLVVTGAPKTHWKHAWDDDDSNDEQWPYKVKFENTNLLGEPNRVVMPLETDMEPWENQHDDISVIQLDTAAICRLFQLTADELRSRLQKSVYWCAMRPDGSYTRFPAYGDYGYWYAKDGNLAQKAEAAVYAEFIPENFTMEVGQNPGICEVGDTIVVRQAFEYVTEKGYSQWLVIPVKIAIVAITPVKPVCATPDDVCVNTLVSDMLYLQRTYDRIELYDIRGFPVGRCRGADRMNMSRLPAGMYVLRADGKTVRICKL